MRRANRIVRRLRRLFRTRQLEAELIEEVRQHVELEAEDLRRRGWSEDRARREALLRLGGIEQTRERVRDGRSLRWLGDALMDLRYAGRSMRRQSGALAAAGFMLAAGIGVNTALFSVVHAVLVNPLPYPDPQDLIVVRRENPATGARSGVSPAEFQALQNDFESAASASLFLNATDIVHGGGEPFEVQIGMISAGLFRALGASPRLGRDMTRDDADPRNPPVVVLSHRLWQERFGGAAGVVGSTLRVGNASATVIGVMEADFTFPQVFGTGPRFDLWRPFPEQEGRSRFAQSGIELHPIVRLKPGRSIEAARAELAALDARFATDRPAALHGQVLTAVGLREQIGGDVRPVLLVLWAAVTAILLIVCANVANILLARATARQHEFAVRASLGAGRARLVRQTLTEGVALSACGGVLGLGLAAILVRLLPRLESTGVPRLSEIDGPFGLAPLVVVASAGLTLGTGLVFGLAPALRISTRGPGLQLRDSARITDGRSSRALRASFVVAQVACAVMLLSAAGLMIRSSALLLSAAPGFDARNVLTLRLVLPRSRYLPRDAVYTQADRVFTPLRADVERLPQVEGVSYVSHLPLSGRLASLLYQVPERRVPRGSQPPAAEYRSVAPGFFRTVQAPLRAGRDFDETDTAASARVAIVNEAFARVNWPDGSAIGRRIERIGWPDPLTVVGLVPDLAHESLEGPASPMVYLPLVQDRATTMSLVVRATESPMAVAELVRQRARALEPEAVVLDVKPLEDVVAAALGTRRTATGLLGIFAGLALCLATLGIYSVVSHSVVQRTPEIGVRIALGARPRQILALVLTQGILLAAGGIALGVLGAFGASGLVASLLFGVAPADPLTLAAVCLTLFVTATVATYLPTRRAMRIDPVNALRQE